MDIKKALVQKLANACINEFVNAKVERDLKIRTAKSVLMQMKCYGLNLSHTHCPPNASNVPVIQVENGAF